MCICARQEGAGGSKHVETWICVRCGERGHLRKACSNPRKPKSGKEVVEAEKDLGHGKKRIASTIVDDQPQAKAAASDGVMPFATTEHRIWSAVWSTCKKVHHTAAQCWQGNKDKRPPNYRAKAAKVRWEDLQHGEAEQGAKEAREDNYRRYIGIDQGPSEQGDIYDQAPRRTWMAHSRALYQTLVEEEGEIYGLTHGHREEEEELVAALAAEPVSPQRSPRLRADNPHRRSSSPRQPLPPPPRRQRRSPPMQFLRPPAPGGPGGKGEATSDEDNVRVPAPFPPKPIVPTSKIPARSSLDLRTMACR